MSNLSNFVRKQIFSERGNVFISHNFQLQPIHFTHIFHITVWSFPQSEIFLLGAPQVCITVGNQSSNRHSVAQILNWSFPFDPIKLTLIPFSTWRAFFTGNIYCKWTKPLQKVKSFLFHLRDCPRQPLGIRWELDYCILQHNSIFFLFLFLKFLIFWFLKENILVPNFDKS